ncbi:hypothetical protein PsorP6_012371 [Peronosclerospora sorghi]|uniref:Uncharacterized protein n=1 Tax=Peronosclerospora sorghi TaxID=230839 RepID=A0ACC0WGE3_9STRA|nr:hypothetical protein PsorP6_012371 [Peronosclerospora sorghi]
MKIYYKRYRAWRRPERGFYLEVTDTLRVQDIFDYDFNRERIFLEIAEAEIAAMHKATEVDKMDAVSEQDNSDEVLAQRGTQLSLSSSKNSAGLQDATSTKRRTTSEEDVAAAISASLREY